MKSQLPDYIQYFHLEKRAHQFLLALRSSKNELGERRLSRRRGISTDMIGFRAYSKGDPPKDISWPVYARTEHLLVREREGLHKSEAVFSIDQSASMYVSYHQKTPASFSKFTAASGLVYILGTLLLHSRDHLYLNMPSWKKVVSKTQLLQQLLIITDPSATHDSGVQTIPFGKNIIPGSNPKWYILSDCFFEPEKLEKNLIQILAKGFQPELLLIQDQNEITFPFTGWQRLRNPEQSQSGRCSLTTATDHIRQDYNKVLTDHQKKIMKITRLYHIKTHPFFAHNDPISVIERVLS